MPSGWNSQRLLRGTLITLAAVAATCVSVFPIYWMLVTAMQSDADLFKTTPNFFPNPREVNVFVRVFTERPVGQWMLNSFIVSVGASVLSLVLSITAAYAMSRSPLSLAKASFGFVLIFTQMVPTVLLMVPLFILFANLHLLNTRLALILVNTAFITPITIWILKGYYDAIHKLEEAAMVDGSRGSVRSCASSCRSRAPPSSHALSLHFSRPGMSSALR